MRTRFLTLNITTEDCQWRSHSAGNFANLAFLLDKLNNRSSGLKRSSNNQSLSISCKSAHYLIVLFIHSMLSVWQKGVDNVLAENELYAYLPILL